MAKNNENTRQSSCAPSGQTGVALIPWSTAFLLFWPVAILGFAFDLWSKSAVFKWLSNAEQPWYSIIDGFLQLVLRENSGAAFSAFQGWTKFLIAISCLALVVVVGFFFSHKITRKLVLFALGCITAGIVGNLYDRLFNEGRVRDFIDVYVGSHHWPTFNVADSLLCIGVGLLIITNLKAASE
ncbi:MAG: signal peptidase II [Phycisphaerae bacterium]|nr:signal peptidase II [Phycisphaerae bacterium]